jgi:hypothetical protein
MEMVWKGIVSTSFMILSQNLRAKAEGKPIKPQ